jgi:hypothetical protein
MNDAIIREVEQHKHLGVIFQDDGCWNSHIDYIIDKATPHMTFVSVFLWLKLTSHWSDHC